MSQIIFMPQNIAIPISDEESILDLALKHKLILNHECGGMGTCGTCRVVVKREDGLPVAERNHIETEMAEDRGFEDNERLACQMSPENGLSVTLPKSE